MNIFIENLGKKYKMTRKALIIGINYIGSNNRLYGCINDVTKVQKELLSGYDSVVKMFDENQTEPKLIPNRINILNQIKIFVSNIKAGDTLYFHYSGHGSYIRDLNGDESDKQDEVICPCKGGFIVDDELRINLVEKIPVGCNLYVVFDSCHSGTGLDLRNNYPTITSRGIINSNYPITKGNVIMFAGCKDNQTSADAWIREERNSYGAMTYFYLKTIENIKRENRKLTVSNILSELQNKIKLHSYEQIPQLSVGQNININVTEWKV